VVAFWGVAWFITRGGAGGTAPDALAPATALAIWAVTALSGFVVALLLRRRAIETEGGVHANLVVAWALLEGPALLAGAFLLVLGDTRLLWAAAPVYLVGFVLTFPRAAWFEERGRRV
jgi:hypothetical protein